MNIITRRERFSQLSEIGKYIESIESLNELIILYKSDIQVKLDLITDNKTLQAQIKSELGIL